MPRQEFNLVVTHEPGPGNDRYVISVLRQVAGDIVFVDSGPGVLVFRAPDPRLVVERLRREAGEIGVIYRVIPVDATVKPFVEDVAEEAWRLSEKIPVDKTYRIVLRGRLYWRETRQPAHSRDAVLYIAEGIKRPVSLENPDYIVYIRSLRLYYRRRLAAVSIIARDEMLSLASGKP